MHQAQPAPCELGARAQRLPAQGRRDHKSRDAICVPCSACMYTAAEQRMMDPDDSTQAEYVPLDMLRIFADSLCDGISSMVGEFFHGECAGQGRPGEGGGTRRGAEAGPVRAGQGRGRVAGSAGQSKLAGLQQGEHCACTGVEVAGFAAAGLDPAAVHGAKLRRSPSHASMHTAPHAPPFRHPQAMSWPTSWTACRLLPAAWQVPWRAGR